MTTPNNTRFNDDAELYLRVVIDYAQAAVKKIERGAVVSDDAFEAILTIKELAQDVYRCVASKTSEGLSEQAQKVYRAIGAIMKEKKHGGASITEINAKVRGYRGKMNRNTIDAELSNAGFMYIDPENGERVALPVYANNDATNK